MNNKPSMFDDIRLQIGDDIEKPLPPTPPTKTIQQELQDIIQRWIQSGKSEADCEHVQTFTLLAFVRAVNRRAELNMVKTGKLEGSHYAAMNKLLEELGIKP